MLFQCGVQRCGIVQHNVFCCVGGVIVDLVFDEQIFCEAAPGNIHLLFSSHQNVRSASWSVATDGEKCAVRPCITRKLNSQL